MPEWYNLQTMSDPRETGRPEPRPRDPETIRIIALERADSRFNRIRMDWLHGNASFEEKEAARLERLRQFCETLRDQRGGLLPNTVVAIDAERKSIRVTLPIVNPLLRNFIFSISAEIKALETVEPNVRGLLLE